MGAANVEQIFVIGFECFETIMDKPIVENEVNDSI